MRMTLAKLNLTGDPMHEGRPNIVNIEAKLWVFDETDEYPIFVLAISSGCLI